MRKLWCILYSLTIFSTPLCLYSAPVAQAPKCGQMLLSATGKDIEFQYKGWVKEKNFQDAPTATYLILQNADAKHLKKLIPILNPSLIKTLQQLITEGTPVLLFTHDSIGGFVTSSNEKFSKYVAQMLALKKSKALIALNKKINHVDIVAHELVHLRDQQDGTAQKIRQELEQILTLAPKNSRNELQELLTQYILEFRAENETVFYDKNLSMILENYQYHSYTSSAATVPNEIFLSARNLFRSLSPELQKAMKANLNKVIRRWTQYQNDQLHLERLSL